MEQEQNTLISITHIVQSLETGFIPVLYVFQVLDEVAMMKRMQKQIEQLESELAKLRGSQVNFLNFILANTELSLIYFFQHQIMCWIHRFLSLP